MYFTKTHFEAKTCVSKSTLEADPHSDKWDRYNNLLDIQLFSLDNCINESHVSILTSITENLAHLSFDKR